MRWEMADCNMIEMTKLIGSLMESLSLPCVGGVVQQCLDMTFLGMIQGGLELLRFWNNSCNNAYLDTVSSYSYFMYWLCILGWTLERCHSRRSLH